MNDFGGIYLDADCEVLNGPKLHSIIEDVFSASLYDAALGVEEYATGHPTAQTVVAKRDSALITFMLDMYERCLSGPAWHWREMRGLIGPQLISLYFLENGEAESKGMLPRLDAPTIKSRVKIYTQDYFSPKFAIDGQRVNYTQNTCVYHLFANLNMRWDDETRRSLREKPALFEEYLRMINPLKTIHRIYFGFDGKKDSCADYLDTWAQQMPGYQIKH